MNNITAVNDFVIKFANVNGTGSASANNMFAKAIYRMGIPMNPTNIFPSNIQGLPTWYEVRVSEKGYLGRRGGVDIMLSVNPQSMAKDIQEVLPGGYFIYDSTKAIDLRLLRDDITFLGIPLMQICLDEFSDPRQRQLFKNIIYVGALAAFLDIEFEVLTGLVADQFKGKEKLIAPNVHALELGFQAAQQRYSCPLSIKLERRDSIGDRILIEGNEAVGLGAVYAGATVAGWYPITPSTSVVDAFDKYCRRMRIDPATGEKNYAIVQAEDELAAIGMVVGASWNGARAFTATSGPGVSLMTEFLGLAYFAEIPVVLINVQRTGPSTGMPTRTQQSDVFACAYASHGDTKHVLLFPSDPKECFDMSADSFDLAEHLQTPVIMLTDLDLGMNDSLCAPLEWDDKRAYNRGKVLNEAQLEAMDERFGRYLDVDGDGIPFRTYPGTHPSKGAFFTRGSSRDEYAVYTENGDEYVQNMERLLHKFDTAKTLVPEAVFTKAEKSTNLGVIHYGTSNASTLEALDYLAADDIHVDSCCVKAFPFTAAVEQFIADHDTVFVVEQNRDGQMRKLIMNECDINPSKLAAVLHYDGMPITASFIQAKVRSVLDTASTQQTRKAGAK